MVAERLLQHSEKDADQDIITQESTLSKRTSYISKLNVDISGAGWIVVIKLSNMKQIIVVKPGTISENDRLTLQQSDCILIEHPNPSEVRIITSLEGIEGNDILDSLAQAVKEQGGYALTEKFTKLFMDKVLARKKT